MKSNNEVALVFLHYWAGSGKEWAGIVEELGAGITAITPDLPGFGNNATTIEYTIAGYTNYFEKLIAESKLKKFILVGHSMGGKIAMSIASRHIPGLAGLALLSPSPPAGEPMTVEQRNKSFSNYGNKESAEETFQEITASKLPAAIKEQVVCDNLSSNKTAYDAWLETGTREDISSQTQHLHIPVLLIVGTADKILTPETHRKHSLPFLPGSTTMHLINGAGHLATYDAPKEVANILKDWINNIIL